MGEYRCPRHDQEAMVRVREGVGSMGRVTWKSLGWKERVGVGEAICSSLESLGEACRCLRLQRGRRMLVGGGGGGRRRGLGFSKGVRDEEEGGR